MAIRVAICSDALHYTAIHTHKHKYCIMSSPIRRRSVLAGKNINTNNRTANIFTKGLNNSSGSLGPASSKSGSRSNSGSPLRQQGTPTRRQSPLKKQLSGTPSPLKRPQPSKSFSFFEETQSERIETLRTHTTAQLQSLPTDTNKENQDPSQEQGKTQVGSPVKNNTISRSPLRELDTARFPGYLVDPQTHETTLLAAEYTPSSSNNSSTNLAGSSQNSPVRRTLRF